MTVGRALNNIRPPFRIADFARVALPCHELALVAKRKTVEVAHGWGLRGLLGRGDVQPVQSASNPANLALALAVQCLKVRRENTFSREPTKTIGPALRQG